MAEPSPHEYRFVELTSTLHECSGCGTYNRMKQYARLAPVSDAPADLYVCSGCATDHGELGPPSPASAGN